MSDSTHATLRADVSKFEQMIRESALDGKTSHDDIYLNILDDEVQVLQMAHGEVVLSYCSFYDDYFKEISLEREVREMTGTDNNGNDFTYEVGAEAIFNVDNTLTRLEHASTGGTVELSVTGSDERRLSSYVRANGALKAWTNLPGSQNTLDNVPHWLPDRFNSENKYTNTAGDEAPTQIETSVANVQQIIQAVNDDANVEFYPVTVEDGEFTIDIGEEDGSGVEGVLSAQNVKGPDVENYYFDGFEEIFKVIGGPIELQTAPGGNPLAVVQDEGDGRVIRHVNGSV